MKDEMSMQFGGQKRSARGVAGFVLAIVCTVVLIVLCILSAVAGGAAGAYVGAIGMIVFFASIGAFMLSLQGVEEDGVSTTIPMIGLILSGILLVTLFCFYITGL